MLNLPKLSTLVARMNNLYKVFSGLVIFALGSILAFSCAKPNETTQEADTETQSSVDIAWAVHILSDIDMIASFYGENNLYKSFYNPAPDSDPATGTLVATRDGGRVTMSFANAPNITKCLDGASRSGEIWLYYQNGYNSDPNAKYFHDPNFVGVISGPGYEINNYRVEFPDANTGDQLRMYTQMKTGYTNLGPLSWKIYGDIKIIKKDNPNIYIELKCPAPNGLIKTLTPAPGKTADSLLTIKGSTISPINWKNGIITYNGTLKGTYHNPGSKHDNKSFELNIKSESDGSAYKNFPIQRDLTCYSDKIYTVAPTATTGIFKTYFKEYHPFINGIATLTLGACANNTCEIYPREIHFGDGSCDNTGKVVIRGITYEVNFREK